MYTGFCAGAHHIDLRAATTGDPDWLIEQRESEIDLIEDWIENYHQRKAALFDM